MKFIYDRPINIYIDGDGDPCSNYKLLTQVTYDEFYYDEGGCEVGSSTRVYWWYTTEKPELNELIEYIKKEWNEREASQIIAKMKKFYKE